MIVSVICDKSQLRKIHRALLGYLWMPVSLSSSLFFVSYTPPQILVWTSGISLNLWFLTLVKLVYSFYINLNSTHILVRFGRISQYNYLIPMPSGGNWVILSHLFPWFPWLFVYMSFLYLPISILVIDIFKNSIE
jgi:hypothetical protein